MDDDNQFESKKFDDCRECKNRFCEMVCDDCGMGEEFEPEDIDEVDAHFGGRI